MHNLLKNPQKLSPLLLSIWTLASCGNANVAKDPELKIEKKVDHSHRFEQLEVDNDIVERKKANRSKDEVTPPTNEPVADHLFEAYELVNTNDHTKAIELLTKELAKNKKDSRVLSYMGKVYRDDEKFDKAKECFDKAIKYAPNDPFPYCLRAETQFSLENYAKSIQDCNKALELNPDYSHARSIRGQSYLLMAKYKNAIDDLKIAHKVDPENATICLDLADAYRNLQDNENALAFYDKAAKIDEDNALIYYHRAQALTKMGKDDLAQADFKKAKELGYVAKQNLEKVKD